MIKGKPITQNPERYNIKSDSWVVSASPNIKPLEFNFGKPLDNLKPVLQADGLIINTGGAYLLCSQNTIDIIKAVSYTHLTLPTICSV